MNLSNIIHYIVWQYSKKNNSTSQSESLKPIKLNKILWFADRKAIIQTGESITKSVYIKKPYGPAIQDIDNIISDLVQGGQIKADEYTDIKGYKHACLNSDINVDVSKIEKNYIQFLDESIDESLQYRTDEHSEKSHDEAWEMVGSYHDIPFRNIYFSRSGEVPEENIIAMKEAIKSGEVKLQEFSK